MRLGFDGEFPFPVFETGRCIAALGRARLTARPRQRGQGDRCECPDMLAFQHAFSSILGLFTLPATKRRLGRKMPV